MNDQERDKNADERIADALERQNRLLEDQNAILHDGLQTLIYALYDEEGRKNLDGRTPQINELDGLANLMYLSMGGRTDGQPEDER